MISLVALAFSLFGVDYEHAVKKARGGRIETGDLVTVYRKNETNHTGATIVVATRLPISKLNLVNGKSEIIVKVNGVTKIYLWLNDDGNLEAMAGLLL